VAPPVGVAGEPSAPATPAATRRDVPGRILRGRPEDPAWARPALLALLAGTGLLYLWSLGASGWANAYYSAAAQAGSQSWKAFLFGSFDAGNAITVDKAPLFLWPMALSARLFGVSSWSILAPQALEGVASVGVLYLAVRRWAGPAAGLIAGTVLALTPVAALMFRFNNPDSALVLLLTLGAYATVRAIESGATRWVVAVGVCVGLGFLAKMLQAFLVVPGFALAFAVAAPGPLRFRVRQLVVAGVAMVVSAGWWVALVELWPASSRPYVGGSQDNSLLNLIFGYNGFGRLTGDETGSVGGGPLNTSGRWGPTGLGRLFNDSFGGQISWLLPAGVVLGAVVLVATWQAPRTDRTRAAVLLWGGWLVVTGLAISLGEGIIHEYYTVALAPPIGALIGVGAVHLWRRRDEWAARAALAATVAVTAWWAGELLSRTPDWHPGLRPLVVVGGLVAAVGLLVPAGAGGKAALAVGAAALGVVAAVAGPAAASWATAATPHSGAIPMAGPSVTAARFGGPGGGVGSRQTLGPFSPGRGGGFRPGQASPLGRFPGLGGPGTVPRGGGVGGILEASEPSSELTAALAEDAGSYRWLAAVVSANQAAGYQLATGGAVMALGGFNGTDPSPTLAQFQQLVAQGDIHWFIGGGFGARNGNEAGEIATWVAETFPSQTVGGVTLYDLTTPAGGGV
jgi:4-amino-4-deoxy-L-arabinose transferase-like glycosyltransferase